jgi:beta-phosphoglucomutase-like phosphatase (HAD superfamily)
MDDPARLGTLARRFAPATCLVLDDGVQGLEKARVIGPDGRVG